MGVVSDITLNTEGGKGKLSPMKVRRHCLLVLLVLVGWSNVGRWTVKRERYSAFGVDFEFGIWRAFGWKFYR
jgi:hypothetical protein